MLLEPVEQRLLLSADLPFSTVGYTDIAVTSDGANIQIWDTSGTPSLLTSALLTQTSALRLTGSNTADRVTIDLTVPFEIPVYFEDTDVGDGDELEVLGLEATRWWLEGNGAGTVAVGGGITFSGIENLTGAPGNSDTFAVDAGGSVWGLIDGGEGGFDTLELVGADRSGLTLTNTSVTVECTLGAEAPPRVAILSGNGLEHALIALGAMYVGVPFAPVSPAYSKTPPSRSARRPDRARRSSPISAL